MTDLPRPKRSVCLSGDPLDFDEDDCLVYAETFQPYLCKDCDAMHIRAQVEDSDLEVEVVIQRDQMELMVLMLLRKDDHSAYH